MGVPKVLIIGLIILLASCNVYAQDWGPMQIVHWENPPFGSDFGFFNPSYNDAESLLYFDTFLSVEPTSSKIYVSHFDSILYDIRRWSDPVELPPPINIDGVMNCTPFITAGGDSLFFASSREGTRGGLDIWLSVKQGDTWSEPINLGDSINTTDDEYSPCWAPEEGILFFDKWFQSRHYLKIYMSRYENSEWQAAEILPEIINQPGFQTYGAFFDEQEDALYFTNENTPQLNDPLKKSLYLNGEWQEPIVLPSTVNGFWYPNYCDEVTTENAFISQDRNLLFYNKWIWEASMCIDFWSYIFVSESMVGIKEETRMNNHDYFDLKIYPNPSNSTFHIQFRISTQPTQIKLYNVLGELINIFDLGYGETEINWHCTDLNGNKVSTGLYFATIESNRYKASRKLILLK